MIKLLLTVISVVLILSFNRINETSHNTKSEIKAGKDSMVNGLDSVRQQLGSVNFSYNEVTGIGHEEGCTRRDPSDVIKVDDTWYVWYTKVYGRSPGYWGTIWYATSKDEGYTWTERGEALGVGIKGSFDSQATFTPNILFARGKYYLFYTGVKPTPERSDGVFENNSSTDITAIGVAGSDSPDGPFRRLHGGKPALEISHSTDAFDSYRIDDAVLVLREGKYWLYYKGRNLQHAESGPGKTMMGVAFSDYPQGPYTRYQHNPILDKSHEVMVWKQGHGVACLASISSTFEYAPDGLDFTTDPLNLKIPAQGRPLAPGVFRPDLTEEENEKAGLKWGISMVHNGDEAYLIRWKNGQEKVLVHSLDELKSAIKNYHAGSEILLANGAYIGETVLQSRKGTEKYPIIIRAKNQGKAVIESTITLAGNYIALMGCRFQGQGNVVIEGKNCRLSRCTFSDSKATKWVRVRPGTSKIEIDHNLFENKTNNRTEKSCQLMQIIVLNKDEQHHIHHNLFRDIPPGSGNGYETLQLITKGNPFDPPPGDCHIVIEHNLFVRCNGEPEVISVKSNGNLVMGNTFRACRGSVVFRHGDNNVATQNCFFGDGEPGSGGVRLQGTDQVVANNYFYELGMFGIGMMDGTPDDLYVRVERAQILFNSFINCGNTMVIGLNHSKHPNGIAPKNCLIAGNIFSTSKQQPLFVLIQDDKPENWTWEDNAASGETGLNINEGIQVVNPHLDMQDNGLAYPTKDTPSSEGERDFMDYVSADLLGQKRLDIKTLGAIQYPVENGIVGFLTEDMVGPGAK